MLCNLFPVSSAFRHFGDAASSLFFLESRSLFLSPSDKVIGNELGYRNTSTGFHEVENCNYIKKFSCFILPRWHEAAYSIALSFLIAPHVTVSKLLNATECTQECLR